MGSRSTSGEGRKMRGNNIDLKNFPTLQVKERRVGKDLDGVRRKTGVTRSLSRELFEREVTEGQRVTLPVKSQE